MPIRRLTALLLIATVFGCQITQDHPIGTAEITVVFIGSDTDPNGVDLLVDGNIATHLAGPGKVTLELSVGQHRFALGGLESNCASQMPAVQTIDVTDIGPAKLSLGVVCTALTGSVRVIIAATGPDANAGAYQVTLNAGPVYTLGPNVAIEIPGVAAGTHSLRLTGLPSNCSIVGANPVNVSVTAGGVVRDRVRATINVTCTALSGVVRVTAATTGPDPDPDGYTVSLDAGPVRAVGTNGSVSIPEVPGGSHSLHLGGLAPNCSVAGSNPVNASVAVGGLIRDTAHVTFNLTCTALPRTGADLVVTTTGANPDPLYRIVVRSSTCGLFTCPIDWQGNVPGNGTVPIALPVGSYIYTVSDINIGCSSGTSSGSFSVTNQQVTRVDLAFTCVPLGTVVVGVQASGVDIGEYYSVRVDGAFARGLQAGASASIQLPVGTHSISLDNSYSNCTVATANPVAVTITAGATTNVSFSVTCVANPVLRVTVTTTGPGAPANYAVGVDYDYYYGFAYSATIPSNGTTSLSLASGNHFVYLDQVPLNCTVTSPNNVAVSLPPGSTTDLAFTVVCR